MKFFILILITINSFLSWGVSPDENYYFESKYEQEEEQSVKRLPSATREDNKEEAVSKERDGQGDEKKKE